MRKDKDILIIVGILSIVIIYKILDAIHVL
jgi:hypothetical protein